MIRAPNMVTETRKWQLTFNNPSEHGFTHPEIIATLDKVKGIEYYCLCDEIGENGTCHTHLFLYLRNKRSTEWVDKRFPNVHRVACSGSCAENRAYILKDGAKFNKLEDGTYHYTDSKGKAHKGKNLSETFVEYGECPEEHQSRSRDADIIVAMIKAGASDADIVNAVPSAYRNIDRIQRTRQMFRDNRFANEWRKLEVTYIYGETGTGKTRSVMDKYGYSSCYRVTDYVHPFDSYDGEDVIIFEEFRAGLRHGDMLSYLDGYPVLLPCRYFNRQACYTKVFIISNVPLEKQYCNIDKVSQEAFFRRIQKVRVFEPNRVTDYDSVKSYLHRHDWVNDCDSPIEELSLEQLSFD